MPYSCQHSCQHSCQYSCQYSCHFSCHSVPHSTSFRETFVAPRSSDLRPSMLAFPTCFLMTRGSIFVPFEPSGSSSEAPVDRVGCPNTSVWACRAFLQASMKQSPCAPTMFVLWAPQGSPLELSMPRPINLLWPDAPCGRAVGPPVLRVRPGSLWERPATETQRLLVCFSAGRGWQTVGGLAASISTHCLISCVNGKVSCQFGT